jgi:hypothetical protein
MKKSSEKGQILIFITLAFVVLGLFVGLAVDGGRAYLLKADLARKIDPAALAAAAAYKVSGLAAAQDAACNSAKMNGLDCSGLTVAEVTAPLPGGGTADGIQVSATATILTSFMQLGNLIGCTICDAVTVAASAVAVPSSTFDLVMDLDDTSSMCDPCSKLQGAKDGANALVDKVVPAGSGSGALVSLVPWRGCYESTGANDCKDSDEYPNNGGSIVPLTTDNARLHGGVNILDGGGGSGTNVCQGLYKARQKLFQVGVARPNAQKFIVLLTDASSNYNSSQAGPYVDLDCKPVSGAGNNNQQLNLLAYKKAQEIENGTNVGATGQNPGQNVTIFVILYEVPGPVPDDCTPPPTGATSWNTNQLNLGRCIASSQSHVYLADDGPGITAAFNAIIARLPVRLVN